MASGVKRRLDQDTKKCCKIVKGKHIRFRTWYGSFFDFSILWYFFGRLVPLCHNRCKSTWLTFRDSIPGLMLLTMPMKAFPSRQLLPKSRTSMPNLSVTCEGSGNKVCSFVQRKLIDRAGRPNVRPCITGQDCASCKQLEVHGQSKMFYSSLVILLIHYINSLISTNYLWPAPLEQRLLGAHLPLFLHGGAPRLVAAARGAARRGHGRRAVPEPVAELLQDARVLFNLETCHSLKVTPKHNICHLYG